MPEKRFIICHIDNWDEFLRLSLLMESASFDDKWFYRGHSNELWKLQTGYERMVAKNVLKWKFIKKIVKVEKEPAPNTKIHQHIIERLIRDIEGTEADCRNAEHLAISKFKKDAFRYVHCSSDIEWLTVMQHYGAPTRLLDVTYSLFASLYFAFENDIYDKDGVALPKCIWAFKQKPLWFNQPEIQKKYNKDDMEEFCDEYYYDEFNREDACLKMAQKAMVKITGCSSVEMDIQSGVIPIIPQMNIERISAQNGLFLFPLNLSEPFEENLRQTIEISKEKYINPEKINLSTIFRKGSTILRDASLIKLVFDSQKCHSAEKVLRVANISSKNLFPDLIGIAKNVKY